MQIGFDSVSCRTTFEIKEKLLQCPKCNLEIDEVNTSLAFHLSENHGVTDKLCLRGEKVFKEVVYGLWVLGKFLEQFGKFLKIFGLNQVFMHNVFFKNVLIFLIYIIHKQNQKILV